ncbi:MAG: hypothetical protein FWF96_07920, partial [Kiritimatiellaeota bacterium]|nr:hypothetical protein [Kiritimatiellota bacterium]
MKWFNNVKIRNKFLALFGALLVIMLVFAVFTVYRLGTIYESINELVNSNQARLVFIADATEEYFQIRVSALAEGYMLDGDDYVNAVSAYRENYASDSALFLENMFEYLALVYADPLMDDEEKTKRLIAVEEIERLFFNYEEITGKITKAAEIGDKDEIARIFKDAIPLGIEISAKLKMLRDEVFT